MTEPCPFCHYAVPAGQRVCPSCGAPAKAFASTQSQPEHLAMPPHVGGQVPPAPQGSAAKKPKNRGLKLGLFVLGLVIVSFKLGVLGILLGFGMIGLAEFARRTNRVSFVSWVLTKPPSGGQSMASLAIGVVLLISGGLGALVTIGAKEEQAAEARRRSDLAAQVPQRVAEWSAELAQVQKLAEAPEFVGGGLATVDAVTAAATAMASNLPGRAEIVVSEPPPVPWLAQRKAEAATVRAKYAARADFEQAVRDVGEQFQAAKDQTAAHKYVAADQACTTALARLDTIGKADAWLVGLLPAGFDRTAKQKEIGAFRAQIAAPVAAEKRKQENEARIAAQAAEALPKAEEKKRLAARQFIWLQPEGLAQQLAARNDPDELWGTQYQGKFVRWAAKYERSGVIVKFVASTGDVTSLSCEDFDPAHDPAKFDDVTQWSRISVEGKLDTFQKQIAKDKVEFKLTECIARKL